MTRFVRANWLILCLVALAALQLGILRLRPAPVEGPPLSNLQVGDTLSEVRAFDSVGKATALAGGVPTVLLVFHSECGHCESVAPLWKAWTGASRPDVRAVAVSSESMDSARAFAEKHEWDVEVWTVDADRVGGLEHALTSRAPWVFILDRAGVVLAEGHGNSIAELGTVVGVERG